MRRQTKIVLFLCTGNYYRSRFAEILFNSVAGKMGLPWKASSRGLALERGVNNVGPMAHSAIKALATLGLRSTEDAARFPVQVTMDDFDKADFSQSDGRFKRIWFRGGRGRFLQFALSAPQLLHAVLWQPTSVQ
jgi:hypothetical protein